MATKEMPAVGTKGYLIDRGSRHNGRPCEVVGHNNGQLVLEFDDGNVVERVDTDPNHFFATTNR
jgi:hypothetical protein